MRVRRFIETVKPWHPSQYYGRVRSVGKNYLKGAFPSPARQILIKLHPEGLSPVEFRAGPKWLPKMDRSAEMAQAQQIIEGVFSFHGISQTYSNTVKWRNPVDNYLWDVQLNSFGFLDSLRCLAEDTNQRPRAVHCGKDLMCHWIHNCPYPTRPGWHPEVISARTCNWIKFLIDFPAADDHDIWDSISQQMTCLRKNVEIFLPGSQLVEDGIALAFAGLYFFEGGPPRRWLERGMRIVSRELARQILPGGGHFERSPMYHCILLESLIDCYNLLKAREMEPLWLAEKLRSMTQRMADFIHPDQEIPLLNDSALAHASNPLDILHYAKCSFGFKLEPPSRSHEDDGYFVFRDTRSFLIIDGGPIGPDYLPSHGHADTLSYELSIDKKRVIVDSGVFSYLADDLRAYCRGTAAHNTVVVDSHDQSEMWRSFRVGHRARTAPPIVFDDNQLAGFTGAHDGYRVLPGSVIHTRTLLHVPDKFFIVCDKLSGSGTHRLESYIHLSPDLKVEWHNDRCVVSGATGVVLQIPPFGCCTPQINHCWYCPEFGRKVETMNVVLTLTSALPCHFGYFLIPGDAAVETDCGFEKNNSYFRVAFRDGKTVAIRGIDDRYILE